MLSLKDVSVTTLENGATVVTVPEERAESVALGIMILAGGRHESSKLTGISHFLEHMLFKGTARRSAADISRAVEGRGGVLNACTSENYTFYYAHLPYEYTATAFDVLYDMYQNATIEAEAFEREREVIIEEIKMYDDLPNALVVDQLKEAIFPGHALGRSLAGSPATLSRMTPELLHEYKRKNYVPAATYFVFSGRTEHARALDLVGQALQGQPRGSKPRCHKWRNSKKQQPLVVKHKDIAQSHACLGFRVFGYNDPRTYALGLLDGVLGMNMSSRLFQSVRERHGLCYDIRSERQLFEETGTFHIYGGFDTSKTMAALKLVGRELRQLRQKEVGVRELQRAREYLLGRFRLNLEHSFGRLFYVIGSLVNHRRLIAPTEHIALVKAVTAPELRQLAREVFDADNMSLSLVGPESLNGDTEYWWDVLRLDKVDS